MSSAPLTTEQVEEVLDVLAEFMDETMIALDVGSDLEAELEHENGIIHVDLDGDRDDIALLIGKRGQTLDAVQYVANAIVATQCGPLARVEIDAQGYRSRRATQLEKQAEQVVNEVARQGRAVEMDPMTSSERKVVHLFLKDHPDVMTESTGRDPQRRVVVMPRRD